MLSSIMIIRFFNEIGVKPREVQVIICNASCAVERVLSVSVRSEHLSENFRSVPIYQFVHQATFMQGPLSLQVNPS